jgi:hypothetical protein
MLKAMTSGLLGAIALTALHQAARRSLSHPPRMDLLGERAIARGIEAAGMHPPRGKTLQELALAGDLVSNSLYYSLVGIKGAQHAPACGALLGLLAGVGAVVLPGPLGLGNDASNRTRSTTAATIGLYLAGGLVTLRVSIEPSRALLFVLVLVPQAIFLFFDLRVLAFGIFLGFTVVLCNAVVKLFLFAFS